MKTDHYLHIEGVSALKRFIQRYLANLTSKLTVHIRQIFRSIDTNFVARSASIKLFYKTTDYK